jgi:hypothetical protein
MVSFAPPATMFYLTEWTPYWLDLSPKCRDIADGLRAVPSRLGTVHDSVIEASDLVDQAYKIGFKFTTHPAENAETAITDGEQIRHADAWMDDVKLKAFASASCAIRENPPMVAEIQEMRTRITGLKGGLFGMVQILFVGLRRGVNVALFGAMVGGDFVIRELGTLMQSRGSGYILVRDTEQFEVEIMFWSDAELMDYIEPFTSAGFELISTPIVIMCPPVPSDYDERLRWAERFIDDGLGMCVVV